MPSSCRLFLSTLSLRRATIRPAHGAAGNVHFYPRSPCGERRCLGQTAWCTSCISIHALLAESDAITDLTLLPFDISIHALLAESDVFGLGHSFRHNTFLSTLSLRRATTAWVQEFPTLYHFYPRSPCGERHRDIAHRKRQKNISIHALLAESDPKKHQ